MHFLVLGAVIFAGYRLRIAAARTGEPGKIVVTQGQLASMWEGFTRTRQRPPTREEWEGLIRDRVREEVYYREALALGLDKDDTVIRRRLQQKMEFVSDDIAAQAPADRRRVECVSAGAPRQFRVEPRFTFRQLYLNPEKHGDNLARDAAQLLAKLNQAGGDADFAALGDPFMLDHIHRAAGQRDRETVRRQVRREAGRTSARPMAGPVESGFGVHLVFVSERTEGTPARVGRRARRRAP